LIYAQLELIAADQRTSTPCVSPTEHPTALLEKHATAQAALVNRSRICPSSWRTFPCDGREYLSKVVDELAQNAFRFSDPGSSVRLSLNEAFNTITLTISDQGRGFTAEQITRIGRLYAIRSHDAGATGVGARPGHRQAARRPARRHTFHCE